MTDVILAISELKNTKSTGHDQINLQHIKESLIFTILYITLIINTSIVINVFPKPRKTQLLFQSIIQVKLKNQQISDQLINFQSYQKYWKKSYQLN